MRPYLPTAIFIVTHHARTEAQNGLLDRTMRSLQAQTDPDWHAVIVDDGSPHPDARAALERWQALEPRRVHLEHAISSGGAGAARNLGVRRAAALGADIILYNDNDDLSHPDRLAGCRALFARRPEVDFIYTGFHPVDASDRMIPPAEMRVDMLDIYEALSDEPPQGDDIFAAMAARTGCLVVPSMAAMRLDLAARYPFPGGFASEDNHTWLRMAAGGAHFAFLPKTSMGYRMLDLGLSDLGCNGRGRRFLWEKARNDIDGFECGAAIALSRGRLAADALAPLTARFLDRLARCVDRQGEAALAAKLRGPAQLAGILARLGAENLTGPLQIPPAAACSAGPRGGAELTT